MTMIYRAKQRRKINEYLADATNLLEIAGDNIKIARTRSLEATEDFRNLVESIADDSLAALRLTERARELELALRDLE